MKNYAFRVSRILNSLYSFCSLFSGIGIAVIALITFFDVIMRYFFNSPTFWASEISEYIIIWAVFLSMAWVLSVKGHIHVEVIYDRLPYFGKKIADLLCILFSFFFFSIFTYGSIKMSVQSVKLSRASISPLHMPMIIPQISLVIGGALVLFQLIISLNDTVRSFSGKDNSKTEKSEFEINKRNP